MHTIHRTLLFVTALLLGWSNDSVHAQFNSQQEREQEKRVHRVECQEIFGGSFGVNVPGIECVYDPHSRSRARPSQESGVTRLTEEEIDERMRTRREEGSTFENHEAYIERMLTLKRAKQSTSINTQRPAEQQHQAGGAPNSESEYTHTQPSDAMRSAADIKGTREQTHESADVHTAEDDTHMRQQANVVLQQQGSTAASSEESVDDIHIIPVIEEDGMARVYIIGETTPQATVQIEEELSIALHEVLQEESVHGAAPEDAVVALSDPAFLSEIQQRVSAVTTAVLNQFREQEEVANIHAAAPSSIPLWLQWLGTLIALVIIIWIVSDVTRERTKEGWLHRLANHLHSMHYIDKKKTLSKRLEKLYEAIRKS